MQEDAAFPAVAADPPAAAPAAETMTVHRFSFHGTAGEYFKIWFVNIALTVITLGIFSAWAKVRTKRYFYANTFLDGANFEYHANPLSILTARIILLAVLAGGSYWAGEDLARSAVHSTLLAFLLPWAAVRGFAFNARYSSYRNLRFSFNKKYGRMYLVLAPILLLLVVPAYYLYFTVPDTPSKEALETAAFTVALVVGVLWVTVPLLLMPPLLRVYHAFKAENHALGGCRFAFNKPPLTKYWAVPIIAIALIIVLWVMLSAISLSLLFSIAPDNFAAADSAPFHIFIFAAIGVAFYFTVIWGFTAAGIVLFRLFWNNLVFAGGSLQCPVPFWRFLLTIQTLNMLAISLSFGLLYPWARIRKVRFLAAYMQVTAASGSLDSIIAARGDGEGAFGEEFNLAEGLDFDVGLV